MTASRTALSLLPYYLPKVTCKKVNAGIYCTSISTNLQGCFCKYAYRLRRYCTKINAQRIIDTPPLYFCSCLVSGITIFKSAGDAELPRMAVVPYSSDVFAWAKTRVQQCTRMYTAGQAIFKSASGGASAYTFNGTFLIERCDCCSSAAHCTGVYGFPKTRFDM